MVKLELTLVLIEYVKYGIETKIAIFRTILQRYPKLEQSTSHQASLRHILKINPIGYQ